MTAMCIHKNSDKSIPVWIDDYYEKQASQEEIFLEETEEETAHDFRV